MNEREPWLDPRERRRLVLQLAARAAKQRQRDREFAEVRTVRWIQNCLVAVYE